MCKTKKWKCTFTASEWKHASDQSKQGKCKQCMRRSPKGLRKCKDCKTSLPLKDFSICLQARAQCAIVTKRKFSTNSRTQRCNTCITIAAIEEDQKQFARYNDEQEQSAGVQVDTTATHQVIESTEKTCTTVSVLCRFCNNPRDIRFEKLWERDTGTSNRFRYLYCFSCKRQSRLSGWNIPGSSCNDDIQSWLQRYSCDGISFLKHKSQPLTATVELFKGQTPDATKSVIVLCKWCNHGRDIPFFKLWQRNGRNRFQIFYCKACKIPTALGAWKVGANSHGDTVATWLERYSYDGISFLDHTNTPPTATTALFTNSWQSRAPFPSRSRGGKRRERGVKGYTSSSTLRRRSITSLALTVWGRRPTHGYGYLIKRFRVLFTKGSHSRSSAWKHNSTLRRRLTATVMLMIRSGMVQKEEGTETLSLLIRKEKWGERGVNGCTSSSTLRRRSITSLELTMWGRQTTHDYGYLNRRFHAVFTKSFHSKRNAWKANSPWKRKLGATVILMSRSAILHGTTRREPAVLERQWHMEFYVEKKVYSKFGIDNLSKSDKSWLWLPQWKISRTLHKRIPPLSSRPQPAHVHQVNQVEQEKNRYVQLQ